MDRAIATWAPAGVLVAVFWALYAAMTFPAPTRSHPFVWLLAQVTCPIAFANTYFHFGIRLGWVILANAATYALFGAIVEALRRQRQPAGSLQ